MIQKARWEWLKALIAFLYLYGCRITEALNLRKRNLTMENGYIIAEIGVLKRRDKQKGPYENMPHLIHISIKAPFVEKVLIPYLYTKTESDMKLFPYSRQLVWFRLKELNQLVCPHVFRHDRLMKLALKGATEAALMDWAGWSDSRPASTYIRATGRLAAQMADKVE
jgi:integrase